MTQQNTFVVFGATGQTGQHFVSHVLAAGHRVRALVRHPAALASSSPHLDVREGDITAGPDLDGLLEGADFVISMLGNARVQRTTRMNTAFVQQLIPAMRRQGIRRFLYQAGGLSRPPHHALSPALWLIRNTVARAFIGQHEDNEAVMAYLTTSARDIEWIVHRASIRPRGASRGVLRRSRNALSIATFEECAAYNYRTLMDPTAIHTCDLSCYGR